MRGGKREGAGRKSEGRTAQLNIRVTPAYAERIKQVAKDKGISQGQLIEEMLPL